MHAPRRTLQTANGGIAVRTVIPELPPFPAPRPRRGCLGAPKFCLPGFRHSGGLPQSGARLACCRARRASSKLLMRRLMEATEGQNRSTSLRVPPALRSKLRNVRELAKRGPRPSPASSMPCSHVHCHKALNFYARVSTLIRVSNQGTDLSLPVCDACPPFQTGVWIAIARDG